LKERAMKWFFIFGPACFLCLSLIMPSSRRFQACLPEGVNPTQVVSVQNVKSSEGGAVVKKITVNDKLIEIKAHCKKGKLVDGPGKEIRFYMLKGCWGNPPADYLEILQRQQNELDELKKHYTVIEIPCESTTPLKLIH
jgi:hypothetical protein